MLYFSLSKLMVCSVLTGKNFVYWFGPVPRLVIPQPELIRELLCQKFEQFEKPEPFPQLRQLSGDGLANSQGEKWARQRRLLRPAFHAEALKVGKFTWFLIGCIALTYWTQTVLKKTSQNCLPCRSVKGR